MANNLLEWRHDIQPNDTHPNDMQQSDLFQITILTTAAEHFKIVNLWMKI